MFRNARPGSSKPGGAVGMSDSQPPLLPEERPVEPGDHLSLCTCGRSSALPDCTQACAAALQLKVDQGALAAALPLRALGPFALLRWQSCTTSQWLAGPLAPFYRPRWRDALTFVGRSCERPLSWLKSGLRQSASICGRIPPRFAPGRSLAADRAVEQSASGRGGCTSCASMCPIVMWSPSRLRYLLPVADAWSVRQLLLAGAGAGTVPTAGR